MKRTRTNTTSVIPASKRQKIAMNARIGGLVGMELKYHDCFWAQALNASGPGTLPERILIDDAVAADRNHLTPVNQGSGETQRIGRNIFARSLNIKLNVDKAQVAAGDAALGTALGFATEDLPCTVWLVKDKQSNSTTPTNLSIWVNPSAAVNNGSEPYINLEYRERFQIVKKWKFNIRSKMQAYFNGLSNLHTVAEPQAMWTKNYMLKFTKPWKQQYDGTGGGIGNVTNESYSLWASYPTANTTINSRITVAGMCRVRYTS